MDMLSIEKELQSNSYPGRGIIIGKSADGTKAVTAYFIMGRSENSRNRVFVELQRRVAPNYPKNQRRKQSRDDREGDYRLFLFCSHRTSLPTVSIA